MKDERDIAEELDFHEARRIRSYHDTDVFGREDDHDVSDIPRRGVQLKLHLRAVWLVQC